MMRPIGSWEPGAGTCRWIALGTLAILLMFAAPPVRGQTPPRKLSLQQALELAERQNLDLAAARDRHAVTAAGVPIAKEMPNPIIHFAALRDTPHESLFLTQPIETGGKRGRRVEVAQQEIKLTDVEIGTLARQLRRNVREAFYNLALARATSDQLAQALKLGERLRDIAQQRFQAGDVPQLEVIQAELGMSQAQANLQIAQQDEKVALSRLNALLSEPPSTLWELISSLEAPLPALTLEDLTARAQASNSELQHLAQEKLVQQSRHSLLKAERIPDLEFEFGADFNSPPSFQVGGRGQISLMLPIFKRNQGELAQSLATEHMIDLEMVAAKRKVAAQVEEAYLEVQARQTQVDLYRRALRPAAGRLEGMSEDSYRAGKSNILTVIDSQRNVQQVEREYLQSELALQSAFAVLEEAIGAPLE